MAPQQRQDHAPDRGQQVGVREGQPAEDIEVVAPAGAEERCRVALGRDFLSLYINSFLSTNLEKKRGGGGGGDHALYRAIGTHSVKTYPSAPTKTGTWPRGLSSSSLAWFSGLSFSA